MARNGIVLRLPATGVLQPVGHVVIGQFGFRLDVGGEERDVVFDGAIGGQRHLAGQHRTHDVRAQGAQIVRQLTRQHRNIEARQIVGECADFCRLIQLAAFDYPGGWVGDGHGEQQLAVGRFFYVQRIIHIFSAGAVDSDEVQRGQIAALKTFVLHFGGDAVRRFFFQIVTGEGDPPRHKVVVTVGDKLGEFGVEATIAFQRMTAHFSNGPVTLFEIVCDTAVSAAWNGIF